MYVGEIEIVEITEVPPPLELKPEDVAEGASSANIPS